MLLARRCSVTRGNRPTSLERPRRPIPTHGDHRATSLVSRSVPRKSPRTCRLQTGLSTAQLSDPCLFSRNLSECRHLFYAGKCLPPPQGPLSSQTPASWHSTVSQPARDRVSNSVTIPDPATRFFSGFPTLVICDKQLLAFNLLARECDQRKERGNEDQKLLSVNQLTSLLHAHLCVIHSVN